MNNLARIAEWTLIRNLIIFALSAAAFGCTLKQPPQFNLAEFTMTEDLPYDSPAQVIYRIDDHRFVTLEHYRDCNHGESFYNDTKKNLRSKIGNGYFENYRGKIVNADPSGNNIVLPLAYPPHVACGKQGCATFLWYSTDSGQTFHALTYIPRSFDPYKESRNYKVFANEDAIYVSQRVTPDPRIVETIKYPMIPGFVYFPNRELPGGKHIEFYVEAPRGLHSPSYQDHVTCDASIKPTNPNAPLAKDRQ
ncbi:T6SS immunity protein Tli3 family protein [Paraburkholderia phosphatilytica]|uniref:T6SS immunity protein Tli3 family protein n=1 Tax=Paraburkholderia phosphatilytica TaxID=2282883 RepID=UPI000E4D069E|nr:hypothetical protein [Paraburkholderia phosphatilytica]